jgi:hypothetical protein
MMPDGAEPCKGFLALQDEIERLREALRLAREDAKQMIDHIDIELEWRGRSETKRETLAEMVERKARDPVPEFPLGLLRDKERDCE